MTPQLVTALIIMLLGLIGSLVPLLPGPPLIWLGALFYAWTTDFSEIGWLTLTVLFLLMLAAVTSDFWVSAVRQRQAGVSLLGTLLSTSLGILGLVVFSLPGMIVGSIIGAVAPDYIRYRDWRRSLRLSRHTLISWLVGAFVQFSLGIVMIVVFIIQVWR